MTESDRFDARESLRKRVKELFAAVIGLPPQRRDAFVAKACSSDDDFDCKVAEEVRSLLRHHHDETLLVDDGLARDAVTVDADASSSVATLADSNAVPTPVQWVGTDRVAQYRLTRLIGAGGMGQVYEAEHELMRRPAAIKLIRPEGDDKAIERFEREVIATAKLSHPNTIDVYDFGRTPDGVFYLAMELLPGMSLHQMVQQFGKLPPSRVIHLARQVCGALAEAHDLGLVHRDVKPANIFASQRGGIDDFAKLLDFGIARGLNVRDLPGAATDLIAGTPDFMSPEQSRSPATVDGRSDLYSLGVTMFYLTTARLPIHQPTPLDTMIAHQNHAPLRLSDIATDVPDDFAAVVMQCLEKNPDHRPASADELAQQLSRCRDADRWTSQDAARWWNDVAGSPAPGDGGDR